MQIRPAAVRREKRVSGEPRMPAPTSHLILPALRSWRLERLLSQRELAEQSGISVPTIIRAEGGKPVGALSAAKLARALGVTAKQLQAHEAEE
jgi:transcriptional regulator with XRE-family HTH domain